ncbi:MAG: hypothetical protein ABR970_13775 [Roseiarcus sp.]|jgi:hypothetical protein
MTRRRRLIFGLIVAAILAGAYVFDQRQAGPLTLEAAVRDGAIEASVVANDPRDGSVTITLTRTPGTTGAIIVAIPPGTLLSAPDGASQRLMTAAAVTIVVGEESDAASATATALCIDPFLSQPAAGAVLAFAPTADVATEETDPIRKLVACMADSPMPDAEKQMAVWAVSAGLLGKRADEAKRYVAEGLVQKMMTERRDQLSAKRATAREMAPALSEAKIDDLIEQEFQNSVPAIRTVAASQSANLLDALRQRDRDVLAGCGYAVAALTVFE